MHRAKAIGRSVMPVGRDMHINPSNTILDRDLSAPVIPYEGDIQG